MPVAALRSSAQARPMPWPPPVTSATLSMRRTSIRPFDEDCPLGACHHGLLDLIKTRGCDELAPDHGPTIVIQVEYGRRAGVTARVSGANAVIDLDPCCCHRVFSLNFRPNCSVRA